MSSLEEMLQYLVAHKEAMAATTAIFGLSFTIYSVFRYRTLQRERDYARMLAAEREAKLQKELYQQYLSEQERDIAEQQAAARVAAAEAELARAKPRRSRRKAETSAPAPLAPQTPPSPPELSSHPHQITKEDLDNVITAMKSSFRDARKHNEAQGEKQFWSGLLLNIVFYILGVVTPPVLAWASGSF